MHLYFYPRSPCGERLYLGKAFHSFPLFPASTVGTFTTSATSVKKTFSSLAQGLYYIKATNFPAGVRSVTNSVVSLPYYNNGWVYSINDIDLATKVNDGDVVTGKTITNSTKDNVNFTDVSLGDTVNFEIKSSTAGSSEMKLKSYTVYDEMSAGLTLDKDRLTFHHIRYMI